MRADLLHAQASIDWAVAQFPPFNERIKAWLADNFDVIIKEQPAPATHNVIVAIQKQPLPLAFNVEAGAYINVIRSSLDILATSLAHRYRIPRPEDAYFPVASSVTAWSAGNYKGAKFVKALPTPERSIIETLKPYQGGNDTLWSLHHLDITRKQKRLFGRQ
jgi:hypothetical protein